MEVKSRKFQLVVLTIDGEIAKTTRFGMDGTSGWDTDQDLSKLIIPWDQG